MRHALDLIMMEYFFECVELETEIPCRTISKSQKMNKFQENLAKIYVE